VCRAFDSLATLSPEFLIADIGSEDGSSDLCRGLGLQVFNVGQVSNFAELRNRLSNQSEYEWQMVLEPWEIVTDPAGIKAVLDGDPAAYFMPILKNNTVSYEVRLWHKSLNISFINPIYEYLNINDDDAEVLSGMLYGDGDRCVSIDILKEWSQQQPASPEPPYYLAFHYLSQQDWDHFLGYASKYLFTERAVRKSTLMMKYYIAIVLCHIKKDANQALKHILECLAVNPVMAEFWCLLGDIYYHRLANYEKAQQFYRNAIVLGSRRQEHDKWPIELPKYQEYPDKMIAGCQRLKQGKQTIVKMPGIHK